MSKKLDKKKILLNTFRPNEYHIEENDRTFFIGTRQCNGNLVVCSSYKTKEFVPKEDLSDENTFKEIIQCVGLDKEYLTEYMVTKIGNSRKNDTIYDVIDEITENYQKYFNFFNDLELYQVISKFLEEVYSIIIDKNIELEFLCIESVNKNDYNLFYDLTNKYIEKLIKLDEFKEMFKSLVEITGFPYVINSSLGDEIHYSNDSMRNCFDEFISIGILISILKKIKYKDNNTIEQFVVKRTNINITDTNELERQLKEILTEKVNRILSITQNEYIEVEVKFNSETRKATRINNLVFFYSNYVISGLENGNLKDHLKEEETEDMRRILVRDYKKKLKLNPSKDEHYNNLIKKISKTDNDTNSYIRKLFKKRKLEFDI